MSDPTTIRACTAAELPRETDVLVIGAGASGIPAAIGAARAGARVVLLEDDAVPGGAAVDQFVCMPDGGPRSGVGAEICRQLETRFALTPKPVNMWYRFWYLPSDYLRVVSELLGAERNITLACGVRDVRPVVVDAPGRLRIAGCIINVAGREHGIAAKTVIEATGTGEFAERAGCRVLYGRDSRADFGEAHAPEERDDKVQLCTWQYISQKTRNVPAFDMRRLKEGGRGVLESGQWFHHDPEAVLKRDAGLYLHWGCRVRCSDTRDTSALGQAASEGLAAMRDDIELLRENGYAVHLAPRIGVREQRRVVGEHVFSLNDMRAAGIPDDAIMVTDRGVDIWTEDKTQQGVKGTGFYGMPYRTLIPSGMERMLVVGKSMSGTHLAMSAFRVQCLLAVIGQTAGVAAAMAAGRGCDPRDLDPRDLRARAVAAPQNLSFEPRPMG